MTRPRRPGAFRTTPNDIADEEPGTLTLEEWRRLRWDAPAPADLEQHDDQEDTPT